MSGMVIKRRPEKRLSKLIWLPGGREDRAASRLISSTLSRMAPSQTPRKASSRAMTSASIASTVRPPGSQISLDRRFSGRRLITIPLIAGPFAA